MENGVDAWRADLEIMCGEGSYIFRSAEPCFILKFIRSAEQRWKTNQSAEYGGGEGSLKNRSKG